jgi:hypothetical protein
MASLIHPAMELVARKATDRFAHCTLSTCPISTSYYFYRVSLAANATFLALFAISLVGFLATYALTRRATAFTVAMTAGVILEVIGYVGRIESNKNQWQQNGFLIQIVCLTIAPAFLAGGIYLCLRRVVYAFGPENSRISPEAYTRIVRPARTPLQTKTTANGNNSSSHAISSPFSYKPLVAVSPPPNHTRTSPQTWAIT